MSKSVFDVTRTNTNVKDGNIENTVYYKPNILSFGEIPTDNQVKRKELTDNFPITIVEGTLTIKREMLETGMFYSLKFQNENLLIKKTVDGRIQIYEVIE